MRHLPGDPLPALQPASPGKTKELFEAGRSRQLDKLLLLQKGFHDLVAGVFGPLPAGDRIDGAYDKMIVRLDGLEEMPLRLLSPYQGFTEEQFREWQRRFREQFPDWSGN